jgi:hypothetical protein
MGMSKAHMGKSSGVAKKESDMHAYGQFVPIHNTCASQHKLNQSKKSRGDEE